MRRITCKARAWLAPLCLVAPFACPAGAQTPRDVRIPTAKLDVGEIAFSPDGKTLAYTARPRSSGNGSVVFVDVKTGKETARLELARSSVVPHLLAFSPDGKNLVAVTGSNVLGPKKKAYVGTAEVWDLAKKQRRFSFEMGEGEGDRVAFANDSKTMFVRAMPPEAAALYDSATGKRLAALSGKFARAEFLAVSGDDKWLVTGHNRPAGVSVWDLAKRKEVRALKPHDQGELRAVAIAPKGDRFLTTNEFGEIRLWDTQKGEVVKSYKRKRGIRRYRFLAFGPDAKTVIASGDGNKTGTLVWDPETGATAGDSEGFDVGRPLIALSPDRKLLATYEDAEGIRFWDLPSAEEVNKRKK